MEEWKIKAQTRPNFFFQLPQVTSEHFIREKRNKDAYRMFVHLKNILRQDCMVAPPWDAAVRHLIRVYRLTTRDDESKKLGAARKLRYSSIKLYGVTHLRVAIS